MDDLEKVMKDILGDNEIIWICDQCSKPIENHQGYICTPYPQSGNKQEKPWKILHAACDPNPESSDYWIEIVRINTWDKLYEWQQHLSEKVWFNEDLFEELIKKAIGGIQMTEKIKLNHLVYTEKETANLIGVKPEIIEELREAGKIQARKKKRCKDFWYFPSEMNRISKMLKRDIQFVSLL